MTKEQRETLEHLKAEINRPKERLIDLLRQIEEISPSQGKKLGGIIGRLEAFQNSR